MLMAGGLVRPTSPNNLLYVVFPDEDQEQWPPVHFPVLLNELQCVLSKHKGDAGRDSTSELIGMQ